MNCKTTSGTITGRCAMDAKKKKQEPSGPFHTWVVQLPFQRGGATFLRSDERLDFVLINVTGISAAHVLVAQLS